MFNQKRKLLDNQLSDSFIIGYITSFDFVHIDVNFNKLLVTNLVNFKLSSQIVEILFFVEILYQSVPNSPLARNTTCYYKVHKKGKFMQFYLNLDHFRGAFLLSNIFI